MGRRRRSYGLRRSVRQGMPDSVIVDLKYGFQVTYAGISSFQLQQFKANSAFDPDLTGIGHQPRFFDQYSAFYGRYMVLSCRLSTTITNLSDADPMLIGVWPAATSSNTISNPSELVEQSYVKTRLIPLAGGDPVHLTSFMTTRKMRGGSVMSDDFSGTTSSDPSRLWYFNHYLVNTAAGNVLAEVVAVLTMRVKFFKRNAVEGS